MNRKGMTLVELLVGVAIFGIIMTGIYSTFITFQKGGYNEIKKAREGIREKVAFFRINKLLESAGFGIMDTDYPNAFVGDEASVNFMTLLGDDRFSGQWQVYPNVTINANLRVSLNEKRQLSESNGSVAFRCKGDTSCDDPYYYWIGLALSTVSNDASTNVDYRNNCAPNTFNLLYKRKTDDPGTPILYCLADVRFEYGYEDEGQIVWDADTTTLGRGLDDLRLVRLGFMIQNGGKRDDLSSNTNLSYSTFQTNNDAVDLNEQMREYRWDIVEELIFMRNLK